MPEDSGQRTADSGQRAGLMGITVQINSPKDLIVYQKAYALAMEMFDLSKKFPAEERYSLTDQIRRSSRSVCANIREAWAKRRYQAHFVSELTDADGENGETESWLDFAYDCQYLPKPDHTNLAATCREVGAMLGSMINNPSPSLLTSEV
jgi:four helix bundle protein